MAKNEETIVLGGIMQDRELDSVSKVPLLGDLPILGHLFRHTTKTKTKVNLLVFLTPHVIEDADGFKRLVARKLAERQKLMDTFDDAQRTMERSVDFGRKPGPLAAMARALAKEERARIEPK